MPVLAEAPHTNLVSTDPLARNRGLFQPTLFQDAAHQHAAEPISGQKPESQLLPDHSSAPNQRTDNHVNTLTPAEQPPVSTAHEISPAASIFDNRMRRRIAHLRDNKLERGRSKTQGAAAAIGGWLGSVYSGARNLLSGPMLGATIAAGLTFTKNTVGRITQGVKEGAANIIARSNQKVGALRRFFGGPRFVNRVLGHNHPEDLVKLTPQQLQNMGTKTLEKLLAKAYEMKSLHNDIYDSSNDDIDLNAKSQQRFDLLREAGDQFDPILTALLDRKAQAQRASYQQELEHKVQLYVESMEGRRWLYANVWNSVESMWPAALAAGAWDVISGKTAHIYRDAFNSVRQWVETTASNITAGVNSAANWVGARFAELKTTVDSFLTNTVGPIINPPVTPAPAAPPVSPGGIPVSPESVTPPTGGGDIFTNIRTGVENFWNNSVVPFFNPSAAPGAVTVSPDTTYVIPADILQRIGVDPSQVQTFNAEQLRNLTDGTFVAKPWSQIFPHIDLPGNLDNIVFVGADP